MFILIINSIANNINCQVIKLSIIIHSFQSQLPTALLLQSRRHLHLWWGSPRHSSEALSTKNSLYRCSARAIYQARTTSGSVDQMRSGCTRICRLLLAAQFYC